MNQGQIVQCHFASKRRMSLSIDRNLLSYFGRKTVHRYECKIRKRGKLVSLLRYKSRPRSRKKMGQKKPKKSHFEVIPAPDSKQALEMHQDLSPVVIPAANYDYSVSSIQKSAKN